jgi:hypothetical protein
MFANSAPIAVSAVTTNPRVSPARGLRFTGIDDDEHDDSPKEEDRRSERLSRWVESSTTNAISTKGERVLRIEAIAHNTRALGRRAPAEFPHKRAAE